MPEPEDYTVGWVCALTAEFVAAQAFLDEKHDDPDYAAPRDNNNYALGSIRGHNVVITVLPQGESGKAAASATARDMLRSYPNIRIGLLVGIGGGAPSAKNDIRLGDIVVSSPADGMSGVFQYDFGKTIQDQSFVITGSLDQPPTILRTALQKLKADYDTYGHQLFDAVDDALKNIKKRKKYSRPSLASDRLFLPEAIHPASGDDCSTCDATLLVHREDRDEEEDDPAVHYGLIASADQLMKDARVRDRLASDKGVLCFEMEAAGIMNHFPCVVIRGICDYADTHKNDEWQGFAAMMAAAYTKDLLRRILPTKMREQKRIVDILETLDDRLESMEHLTSATNVMVNHLKTNQQTEAMRQWLRPPDPEENADRARNRRHTGTGEWFLRSSAFERWRLCQNRALLLQGQAGCGKTVLSSAILDHLLETKDHPVLSFFFDFSDESKQTVDGMLRSIGSQLYSHGYVSELNALYRDCDNGGRRAGTRALSTAVRKVLSAVGKVSIVLDALDESSEKPEVMKWIQELVSTSELQQVQLICTSRPADLDDRFLRFLGDDSCFSIDKNAVDTDIQSYVDAQLEHRSEFCDKPLSQDTLTLIRRKVGHGADGMFRWAYCQLESLALCLHEAAIESALRNLPRNLDETYQRMLDHIPPDYNQDSIRLLQFLVWSERPLRLSEAVDIIATDIVGGRLDTKRRLFCEAHVVHYCSNLVTVFKDTNGREELHLSHFSVKEYLLRVDSLQSLPASISITKTCLAYMRSPGVDKRSPFASFAAGYWLVFASKAEVSQDAFQEISRFLENDLALQVWRDLYGASKDRCFRGLSIPLDGTRLQYACLGGLVLTSRHFIEVGDDVNSCEPYDGFALCLASAQGNVEIVQLLLDNGAHVNLRGGLNRGDALQAACAHGNIQVARVLLERGADVNAECGYYTTALAAAASSGHPELIQLLIDQGAILEIGQRANRDILQNAITSGNPDAVQLVLDLGLHLSDPNSDRNQSLIEASSQGNTGMVTLLLNRGTDVNLPHDEFGSSLIAASVYGHTDVMHLLLGRGADVNVQSDQYGTCLQVTSSQARLPEAIVEILLDKGADVHIQGGEYGNALQAASYCGRLQTVKRLLQQGANVNMLGGLRGTALEAASANGHAEIVNVLLENGASVNLRGDSQAGFYAGALHAASSAGNVGIVSQLLAQGANINTRTCPLGCILQDASCLLGCALEEASYQGHSDVVLKLLRGGVDMNAQNGCYGDPLQAASSKGHLNVVKILLDHGANVNARGGDFDNALQAALCQGHHQIADCLLDFGANVQARGGLFGTIFQAASHGGHLQLVERLLDEGTELDLETGQCGTALQAASAQGHVDIVELLLSKRANPNAQAGEHGTALQAAAVRGHVEVVKLLLAQGANPNIAGSEYGSILIEVCLKSRRQHPIGDSNDHCSTIVKLLLENGADIHTTTTDYGSLLQVAAQSGNVDVVQLLLDYGADSNEDYAADGSALFVSLRNNRIHVARLLMKHFSEHSRSKDSWLAILAKAISTDSALGVQLILEAGYLKADERDPLRGWTRLLWASYYELDTLAQTLLCTEGTGVNDQDRSGRTALFYAAMRGHERISRALVSSDKADINARDEDGRTPLSAAAEFGHCAVVETLLADKTIDVNTRENVFGLTPLSLAAGKDHATVVKILLAASAVDVNSSDNTGRTALSWALAYGSKATVVALVEANGINLNAQDINGRTALMWAAARGEVGMLGRLLDRGADSATQDYSGSTALQIAATEHQSAAEAFLLSRGVSISPDFYGLCWLFSGPDSRNKGSATLEGYSPTTTMTAQKSASTLFKKRKNIRMAAHQKPRLWEVFGLCDSSGNAATAFTTSRTTEVLSSHQVR